MRFLIASLSLILLMSCSNKQSLQAYLVSKDDDSNFKTASLATDILVPNIESLSKDEQATLKKIKSVNIAILMNDSTNQGLYQTELASVQAILKDPKYQSLMKVNAGDQGMELVYIGSDEEIDEVVFYGHREDTGMIVARLNSRNLKPADLAKIMQMSDKMDMSQLESFAKELN